jgi:tetratricopeptide (TPR) repeat protein
MKKAIAFSLLVLLALAVFPASTSNDFSRAIAYYLVGDFDLARKNLDAHFGKRPQPPVKQGFLLLLQNEKWEATKKFSDYLESNHRSLEALTGISLATADIKNSLAIDNLNKALRMDPGFAPAYLCLGQEYSQRNNFPAAEDYFSKSLKYAAVPEFKILLAGLYLKTGQAQKAADLIRPEADAAPANYFYALQAGRACLDLGDLDGASRYITQALSAKPASREAQLLKAQHVLRSGDPRQAKALLAKLKFDYYNPEYSLTFAEALVQLKDRDAEKYLYEVFTQNPWQARVNKLLGRFHLNKKGANVQNWIHRALLAGLPVQELQGAFPAQYSFPAFPFSPVFEVKKMQWLGNRRIVVAGTLRSGEKEKLLVLDAQSLKTIKAFDYEGAIQDIFPSPSLDKVIFSTSAVENEKVYLYTLIAQGDSFKLKPVIGYALNMGSVLVAFNAGGTMAWITDGSLADLAFSSPFSLMAAYGRKTGIYPEYPFPVYSYAFASDRWAQVRSRDGLSGIPLPALRHYLAVANAYQANSDVAKLLEKGSALDITSSEEMNLHFSVSEGYFLITFSDLKNAFQAWAYDKRSNKLTRFDESMFLGDKYYSELEILAFHPEKNEIMVCTRDKQRNLVHFNYRSLLYKKLASGLLAAATSPDGDTICLLSEKNKRLYVSEAALEIIQVSPYGRSKFDSRRDLNAILDCSDRSAIYVTTYNGELLKLDEEGDFSYRQVSLAGAVHQVSPDKRKAAAFINGRFYVLDWQQ